LIFRPGDKNRGEKGAQQNDFGESVHLKNDL
jgi:hypothetical protein